MPDASARLHPTPAVCMRGARPVEVGARGTAHDETRLACSTAALRQCKSCPVALWKFYVLLPSYSRPPPCPAIVLPVYRVASSHRPVLRRPYPQDHLDNHSSRLLPGLDCGFPSMVLGARCCCWLRMSCFAARTSTEPLRCRTVSRCRVEPPPLWQVPDIDATCWIGSWPWNCATRLPL
jgi:hypothetical protein